jgi:hypothetical protein
VEDILRRFAAGEMSLGSFSAEVQADPSTLASQALALITEYENSAWDESELRRRVGQLIGK